MSAGERFFDTNVLLYLLSADQTKAERAEDLLAEGGVISVQVLNEFVAIARRKAFLPWADIRVWLRTVRTILDVRPLTTEVHERGLDIAERHKLNIYDALIVASALDAGCAEIFTEDLQTGSRIAGVKISNPFAAR